MYVFFIHAFNLVVEKTGNSSRLVIIDDGSSDNTYKIISEWGGGRQKTIVNSAF